jgi:hypothetical protein
MLIIHNSIISIKQSGVKVFGFGYTFLPSVVIRMDCHSAVAMGIAFVETFHAQQASFADADLHPCG